ncbi:MAG: O-antigen ligase family protein [Patescibacteria group bacterium]
MNYELGKKIKLYLLLIASAELISFGSFLFPELRQIAFFAILLLTLILSLQKLEYGLLILLAELFIGSKGYLFYFEQGGLIISLRIALFLIIMSVWLAKIIITWNREGRAAFLNKLNLPFWQYYALLGVVVIGGIVNGYWQRNELSDVFFDANAWIYFLIIFPLAYVIKEYKDDATEFWQKLSAVFGAAVAWLIAETLLLLFFFSHNFGAAAALTVYKWIRVTGVGEITFTEFGFYRIFIQSQIYIIIALFIFISLGWYYWLKGEKKKLLNCFIVTLLSSAAILASFSRSFWIGLAVGLFCFFVFLFFCFYKQWRVILWHIGLTLSAAILSVGLIFTLVRFPYPEPIANFSPELIAQRAFSSEAGVSSRWNLLNPLLSKIKQAPLFGKGFGATVTYQTQDPRILEQNPSGEYMTYAFEWGYLDIWLKLGLLGLIVYLALLVKIFYNGIKNFQFSIFNFQLFINIALLSGLVTVMITSFFSPYLNHPLGIGFIILTSFFVIKK